MRIKRFPWKAHSFYCSAALVITKAYDEK